MALSNYLAELWGISIAVISLVFLIKEKHLKRLFALMENEDNLLLCGLASLVIGFSMVLSHNIWVKNWQVIVTIIGWISLLKGLSILFIPELVKKWTKKLETSPFLPFALLITIFIGLAITYLGFTA
ncbi:MAG: hypothetical protein NT155_02060 [Candidatus Staskawiczbacteria bacterium]|nr:hypothetical protein [Candidatus Staskawiczbacteria bacterium]